MANSVSARKSDRQSLSRRIVNQGLRTAYRTAVKSVRKAVISGNKDLAKTTFIKAQSVIDKIADKKIVHKNKAARHKKRLHLSIKAM